MKIDVEKRANDILKKLNIREAPIPVEEIADKLDIEVRYEPFEGDLSGLLYRDGEQVIIGVNSMQPPNRQRFTIAHELGHYLLHEGNSSMFIDKSYRINFRDTKSSFFNREEMEANAFAAALLMPEKLIKRALKEGIDMEDCEEVNWLARQFKVSEQALNIRLSNLFSFWEIVD